MIEGFRRTLASCLLPAFVLVLAPAIATAQPGPDSGIAAPPPTVAVRVDAGFYPDGPDGDLWDLPPDDVMALLHGALASVRVSGAGSGPALSPEELETIVWRDRFPVSRFVLAGEIRLTIEQMGGMARANAAYTLRLHDVHHEGEVVWEASEADVADATALSRIAELAAERALGLLVPAIANHVDTFVPAYVEENPPVQLRPVTPPDGTEPDGTDPDGTDPDGTDPDGTDPDGTDPDGTDPGPIAPIDPGPDGTDPDGTDPGPIAPIDPGPDGPMLPVGPDPGEDVPPSRFEIRRPENLVRPGERVGRTAALQSLIGSAFPVGSPIGKGRLYAAFEATTAIRDTTASSGDDLYQYLRGEYEMRFGARLGITDNIDVALYIPLRGRRGGFRVVEDGTELVDAPGQPLTMGDPTLGVQWRFVSMPDSVFRGVTAGLALKIPAADSSDFVGTGGADLSFMLGVDLIDVDNELPWWNGNLTLGVTLPSFAGEQDLFNTGISPTESIFASGSFSMRIPFDWDEAYFSWLAQVQAYTTSFADLSSQIDDLQVDLLIGLRGEIGGWEGLFAIGVTPTAPGDGVDTLLLFRLGFNFELFS